MRRWWLRVTAGAVVLVAVGAWSLALQVGSGSGEAFALAVPPPTLPASWMPAATEVTTATAVDTSVAIAGAEGAGAAAAGTVCAATVACAVVAVGAIGAAYGTYKLLHWAWGANHQMQAAPATGSTQYTGGVGSFSTTFGGTFTYTVDQVSRSGDSVTFREHWQWTTGGNDNYRQQPVVNCSDGSQVAVNDQAYIGDGNYYGTVGVNCPGTATGQTFQMKDPAHSAYGGPFAFPDVPAPAPLPQHTVKTDIACMDGSGNVSSHAVSVSGTFDDSTSSIPDTSASPCPNGTIPGKATVTETTTGQPDTPLYQVPDPKLDPANPCSAVGSGCVPTLQRVTSSGLWVDDLNDYPSVTMDGSYRCEEEGPATVSPRLDGGQLPMSDCVAAQPSPNPSPSATPSPAPSVLDPYVPKPAPTSDGRSCFPHGIGLFNPIEWVYKPTVCALRWAFVPDSTAVQTDVSTLTNTWDQTPPGVVVTSAHKLIDPFTSAAPSGSADCAGPLVSFSIPSPFSSHPDNYSVAIHPFSMCNQIGAWVHDYFYPLMTLVLYLATFWQVARTLTSTIGLDTPFDEDGGGMASPL